MLGKLSAWGSVHRAGIVGALRLSERMALLFPSAVVVLASVAFLFGGHCARWQWWVGVALACAGALLAKGASCRRRMAAVGLFLALLAGVWLTAGLGLTLGWMDALAYHLPAIRLLAEGWNPVFAATPELLAEGMGIDPWEMRLWHVLSMPKSVWVFCAVAWTFTGASMNLFFPLFPFLFATAAAQVWRMAEGTSAWVRGVVVLVLWWVAPSPFCSMVDCAVALGAMGLLAGMVRALRRGAHVDWLGLAVHTFWLASAKQVGLLAGGVFWVCFSVALLWVRRGTFWAVARRLAAVALALGALLCVVCASPYLTMWHRFGHPLYPNHTADEARFPAHAITCDFDLCNADAAAMGHLGSLTNAYVSRSLAAAYYRWKLGQTAFAPRRSTWAQGGGEGFESAGPTALSDRLRLLCPLALILLFGRREERLAGAMVAVGVAAMPTAMVGYLRYVPWVWFVWPLAVCAVGRRVGGGRRGRLAAACGAAMLLPFALRGALTFTAGIDLAYAARASLREQPPRTVYGYYSGGLKVGDLEEVYRMIPYETAGNPLRTSLCNLRLLCRQEPALRSARVLACEAFGENREMWPCFPGAEFRLAPGEAPAVPSLFAANAALPDRRQRLRNYPLICLKVWLERFPRLLAWRVGGLAASGSPLPRGTASNGSE